MVAKKCPDCDQTLPVACKSCPCGHIFISKKQLNLPPHDKAETDANSIRDQRLRPEIPKLASKDFEYTYGGKAEKLDKTLEPDQTIEARLVITPPSSSTPPSQAYLVVNNYPPTEQAVSDVALQAAMPTQEAHSLGEGLMMSRRKRGRPKGSKNKPKPIPVPGEEQIHHEDAQSQNADSGDPTKRKRGRPKGSKNKPKDPLLHLRDDYSSDVQDEYYYHEPYLDAMPHISKEKAISYSIVLSDINQKMLKQSSMNFI